MNLLIDDQLLGTVLRGHRPRSLPRRATLFTTGYWYVRLCQAALNVADRTGVLSAPFAALPADQRERAVAAVLELPEEVGLVGMRTLGPLNVRSYFRPGTRPTTSNVPSSVSPVPAAAELPTALAAVASIDSRVSWSVAAKPQAPSAITRMPMPRDSLAET